MNHRRDALQQDAHERLRKDDFIRGQLSQVGIFDYFPKSKHEWLNIAGPTLIIGKPTVTQVYPSR